MSYYTTTLGQIIEAGFDLGMKDYPIYNEEHREKLNQLIYNHYWFREIGLETANQFKFFLNRTMNEIMPRYNKLYEAEEKYLTSPFQNYSIEEAENGSRDLLYQSQKGENITNDITQNKTNDSNKTENLNHAYSDLPNNLLSVGDIQGNLYATQADLNNNTITEDNTTDITSKQTFEDSLDQRDQTNDTYRNTKNTTGYMNYDLIEKMKEYRENVYNIDMMIVEDLEVLFMQIYY